MKPHDLFPARNCPHFNADPLADRVVNAYVAWVDLMGAKAIMGSSLARASNYIGKIHITVLEAAAKAKEVTAYPVIDGCYLVAKSRDELQSTLRIVMHRLAAVFVNEKENEQRFLVRGGIAFGRLIHARDIISGSSVLGKYGRYSECLALGTAIGQAYVAENKAPPFGFWVDITARSFIEDLNQPFTMTYWRWLNEAKAEEKQRQEVLGTLIEGYYEWIDANRRALEYDEARIREHRAAACEYFRIKRKT